MKIMTTFIPGIVVIFLPLVSYKNACQKNTPSPIANIKGTAIVKFLVQITCII